MRTGTKLAIGTGALLAAVIGCTSAVTAAGSHETGAPAAHSSTVASSAPSTRPAPSSPAASSSPAMTVGQQQAIESAQNYLSDSQGFSEAGLLQQLTSGYGEGESRADAQFAISYLHPDWYQQAVISAKNYLSDGQGFSKASLYEQLTSADGEQFTSGQANYALAKVGL